MKNKLKILITISMLFSLSACGLLKPRFRNSESSSQETPSSEYSSIEESSEEIISSEELSEEISSIEESSEESSLEEPSSEQSIEESSSEEISSEESSIEDSSENIESSSEDLESSSLEEDSSQTISSESSAVVINPEDPNAKASTINAMNTANKGKSNNTTLYRISGTVQWPNNTKYGNFDLVDSTGYVYVYGCSKNKSSMTKSGNTYSFSNDQSFYSANIRAGDYITMEGIFVWYAYTSKYGVAEFQGYVTSIIRNGLSDIQAVTYAESDPYTGTYYDSISSTQTGSQLLTSLHNLMDTTHTNYVSYNSLDNHFKQSDKSGSKVKCFYSGQATDSFNKEHVWPQSSSGSTTVQLYGEDHGGSDIHHIRPTISEYNSKRGSSMFGEVFGETSGMGKIAYQGGGNVYYTGNVFEPVDSMKGDVARIIMYMYMHYSSEIGGNTQTFYGEMHINWVMGPDTANSWKLLRKWNAMDPVSEEEKTRNEYAFSVQHNRNPFIDHPSYADKIWA